MRDPGRLLEKTVTVTTEKYEVDELADADHDEKDDSGDEPEEKTATRRRSR